MFILFALYSIYSGPSSMQLDQESRCASITLYLLDRYILVFGDKFLCRKQPPCP